MVIQHKHVRGIKIPIRVAVVNLLVSMVTEQICWQYKTKFGSHHSCSICDDSNVFYVPVIHN